MDQHRVDVHLLGWLLGRRLGLLLGVLVLLERAEQRHNLSLLASRGGFAAGLEEVDHLAGLLCIRIRISSENGRSMYLRERKGMSLSWSAQYSEIWMDLAWLLTLSAAILSLDACAISLARYSGWRVFRMLKKYSLSTDPYPSETWSESRSRTQGPSSSRARELSPRARRSRAP